jgi:ABC-type transporter Mla MlaB component
LIVPDGIFPGEIRLSNAVAALAQARLALGSASGSTSGSTSASADASIDLAGLTDFDSAALAVLAALRRDASGSLRFANPPAKLRQLAALYGVDALLFGPADGTADVPADSPSAA